MKVLLLCEAITLAHVGRSMALAEGLAERGVPVDMALCGGTGSWKTTVSTHALPGIGAGAFAAALRSGRPVLSADVLRQGVKDDLQLLKRIRPDVVIGDFRLSLSVSARLAKVPYATLTNAYWCPGCIRSMPMPVLPLSRMLPLPIARVLFNVGKHVVLRQHSAPMNKVRRENGLPSLGGDLPRVYTDADHVLLADVPGMFAFDHQPANVHFLGAVLWAPDTPLPSWWDQIDRSRPLVYVTVGSSGDPEALRAIVQSLLPLGLSLAVATAGSDVLDDLAAPNLHLAKYLPGDRLAARAALVVGNGGSMGCQQAFVADRPVLGICGNMDQFLNMDGVIASGAGIAMRADRIDAEVLRQNVQRLLQEPSYRTAAANIGKQIREHDAVERLRRLLPTFAAPA